MTPVIALVGRPNVGKSTLFNALTHSRDALVADMPGLTRDRKYGVMELGEDTAILIDTGGLMGDEGDLSELMNNQVEQAMDEADLVLMMADAKNGLLDDDMTIYRNIKKSGKPVMLLVNKVDGQEENTAMSEFHRLGAEKILPLAAAHRRGVNQLRETLQEWFEEHPPQAAEEDNSHDPRHKGTHMAIVGRPNVGKSTLVNRLLGEDRVLAFDMPGTTRDSIYLPMEWDGVNYTLIDTAGVRRRGRITDTIEKFSVIKALQAIEKSDVVVVVIDAREGITDQDLSLLSLVLRNAGSAVLAVNKWDHLPMDHRDRVRSELQRRMAGLDWVPVVYISALHGSGLGELMKKVDEVHSASVKDLPTGKLSDVLQDAYQKHQPPMVHGRTAKLRYAHSGGKNPQRIVIHGTRTGTLPDSYKRYLEKKFRDAFKLVGTPVVLAFKDTENPFKGKKNKLTQRQINKRKRLKAFTSRKKKRR